MNDTLIRFLRFFQSRKFLYNINLHLYKTSLRGIGVLNSDSEYATGEVFLLKYLANKKIHTVFDVGANEGGYVALVKKYLPKAKIYAFEPHPLIYKRLEKRKTANIKVFNLGLGSKKGKSKLWDYADNAPLKKYQPHSALSSLYKKVVTDIHKQPARSFPVKLTTINLFAKENKIKDIDYLKIDTEGSEYEVLLGTGNMISKGKIKVIHFEFNEMNSVSRVFFKDFFDLLKGYKLYRLMPTGFFPIGEYRPSLHEIFAFQNIVAFQEKFSPPK